MSLGVSRFPYIDLSRFIYDLDTLIIYKLKLSSSFDKIIHNFSLSYVFIEFNPLLNSLVIWNWLHKIKCILTAGKGNFMHVYLLLIRTGILGTAKLTIWLDCSVYHCTSIGAYMSQSPVHHDQAWVFPFLRFFFLFI